jgi:hypothetical protein
VQRVAGGSPGRETPDLAGAPAGHLQELPNKIACSEKNSYSRDVTEMGCAETDSVYRRGRSAAGAILVRRLVLPRRFACLRICHVRAGLEEGSRADEKEIPD